MARRFEETVNIQPISTRTGASSGLMQLGQQLTQIQQQVEADRRQRVIEESARAGQEAFTPGEKPEFKEERFIGGVSADAFNKGLRHSYLASLSNDVRKDLAQIEGENSSDIESYNNAVGSLRASLAQEVDPSVRVEVLQKFDSSIVNAQLRVKDNQAKRIRKEQLEIANDHLNTVRNDAMITARQLDVDAVNSALGEGVGAVDAMVDANLMTAVEGKETKRTMFRDAATEAYKGDIETTIDNQGIDAAFKKIDSLPTKPPQNFTQPEWDAARNTLRQIVTRQRSLMSANKKDGLKDARNLLKDYETAKEIGFDVSTDETQRVAQAVSAFPELSKRFNVINNTSVFSVLPSSTRQQILTKAQTGQIDDVDQFESFSKANAEIQKRAADDGYSLAVEQGLIEEVPFSIQDPSGFELRVKQAQLMSQHYGVPVSALDDKTASTLAEALPDMTTNEKILLANTLKADPQSWGQIAKKGGTVFALAGSTGDINVMTTVFKGQELIDQKLVKPIKFGDFQDDFNDFIGDTMGAQDSAAIKQAAVAYYAQYSENKDGLYDSGDFEDAMKAVTGGIEEINGFKTVLPRNVEEDDFQDFIDEITPATITELGGVASIGPGGAIEADPATVIPAIEGARIRAIKDNKYVVETSGGVLMSAKDPTKPFIIEYSPELAAQQAASIKAKQRQKVKEARKGREETTGFEMREIFKGFE